MGWVLKSSNKVCESVIQGKRPTDKTNIETKSTYLYLFSIKIVQSYNLEMQVFPILNPV